MFTFPKRLNLALTPTPLQYLTRVSAELGVNLWVKRDDLTGSTLSGNKVRKLEFVLAEAIEQGCNSIVTCGGLQSNHCRATALLGAQLGLKVALVLRGEEAGAADGNLLLDHLAGADIQMYPVREYRDSLGQLLNRAADKLKQQGCQPFVIPTGASDGIGIWGYIAAARELEADFSQHRIVPSHIVSATGSGGTQAGLTLGAHLLGWSTKVLGMAVCDDEAYFKAKVRSDMRDWYDRYQHMLSDSVDVEQCRIHVNDHYIGPGYAKAEHDVFETIAWLARTEGLVLDPVYTGKAFHGLVEEIKKGAMAGATDIVFVHTGGIFGVFPQRDQFDF
ncbi:D-cysteine desulfhydrase family protein [Aestuariicella hydrocarbonica]|uniref:D-cysteine desulfhydrase family protein n=1 Tax=Pseudomaricurvus hydrocarbonicus TaxID=1470433 RepID=A0A9E5MGX3_9GAMM|nr:D-cysteine desulfhydrase family protein [Aestuariicella hydrocarbonica]NHO65256.1 D-cysteine desulfhydrase family protein [Aestuariicella hydrocarbonica]